MKTIILGTAHLKSTPGKCSPDGNFKEYEYSREVCKAVYEGAEAGLAAVNFVRTKTKNI